MMRFDKYYRYAEMTKFLKKWAEKYPNLCKLEAMGSSYEGRDIWVMTVTNFETGPDSEKPAFWVDGNIHATEVSPSTASLHLINKLLTEYGTDKKVTLALDTRVFYIVPRLNPDGAEWALADNPRYIRSSTRPYPREDALDGLHAKDLDGDGRILQMRIPDPNGSWKPHPDEPTLMVRRESDDLVGGDYYRLMTEGEIQNYDGVMINAAPPVQGLDLNRQFPAMWSPEQRGAGDYAGSEPEPRAAMEFIVSHKNITGGISFHTFSGVHLRPPTKGGDDTLPTQDLRTYKRIGEKATEITGYPAISVFHDFAYDPKSYIKGTFDDWLYDHIGIYSWTTEIWSPQQQAGITDYKYIRWFEDHPAEHDLIIYRWFKENVSAETYIDWYEYDHPQLGKVELGGWEPMGTWRNPPLEMLEKEVAPLSDFAIYQCLLSPKLELHSTHVESNGDSHCIRLYVQNTGWLPTNVTQQAIKMNNVRQLEADLTLPDGATLLMGNAKQFGGQLMGRDHQGAFTMWSPDTTTNMKKFEWVVNAPAGSEIELVAQHDRAGIVRTTVTL